MGERDAFTPAEWRTLQFAPFWMFSALVGCYRDFDPLDYEAFRHSVAQAAAAPGRLVREAIGSVATDLDRLTQAYGSESRTIGRGLVEVSTLLRRVPLEEAVLFRDAVVAGVGEGVAKARGRYGRIMSEDDAKELELAAQFLA